MIKRMTKIKRMRENKRKGEKEKKRKREKEKREKEKRKKEKKTKRESLSLKKVGSARLRESDVHPISPKTPAPQYQHIDRKKRKGKRAEDYCRDRAAYVNKEALALLLKLSSPTLSNAGLARSLIPK